MSWAMDQLARLEELGIGASKSAAIGSIIAPSAPVWLNGALDELLGVDFQTLEPMQLYRASDALMAAIEHHLFDRAMGLFDLQRSRST